MGLSEWWQSHKTLRAIKNHAVLGPVLECLQYDLGDSKRYLMAKFSNKAKGKIISNILTDIERRLDISPSPIIPLRERAVELLYAAASLDVLIMKPPTQSKFISGELHKHIQELAGLEPSLKSIFYEADLIGGNYADSWDLILATYQRNHLWANAFVRALATVGDKTQNPNHDWHLQCYRSFCISAENTYRSLLNWPSLIDNNKVRAAAKNVQHMSWVDKVKEESLTIRMTWEDEWESRFGDRDWS